MPYEEVVDTIWDDILDEMELKNCKICDDSDSSCVEDIEIDVVTLSLSDALE